MDVQLDAESEDDGFLYSIAVLEAHMAKSGMRWDRESVGTTTNRACDKMQGLLGFAPTFATVSSL